jgi:hypothetical protein
MERSTGRWAYEPSSRALPATLHNPLMPHDSWISQLFNAICWQCEFLNFSISLDLCARHIPKCFPKPLDRNKASAVNFVELCMDLCPLWWRRGDGDPLLSFFPQQKLIHWTMGFLWIFESTWLAMMTDELILSEINRHSFKSRVWVVSPAGTVPICTVPKGTFHQPNLWR